MEEYTPGQTVTFTNTNDGNKYTGTVVKDLGNGRFTFRAEDGKVYGSEGFGRNWKIKFEADGEDMFESVSLKDLLD
jgi:translation initiation factor IF-1